MNETPLASRILASLAHSPELPIANASRSDSKTDSPLASGILAALARSPEPTVVSGIRTHLPTLVAQQGGLCGICGKPLPVELDEIHVDHIRPRSRGGTDAVGNLQAAHAHCNQSKGANLTSGTLLNTLSGMRPLIE